MTDDAALQVHVHMDMFCFFASMTLEIISRLGEFIGNSLLL